MCSGKIFYDLQKERASRQLEKEVGILRLEELCPFPFETLAEVLNPLSGVREVIWVQEEPRNQGPWPHVESRLRAVVESLSTRPGEDVRITYKGRAEDAVPAVGISKRYKEQQSGLMGSAFE
jgi:probable 2-oxoglutarate dehydrogenase E1 component DHKTD1